MVTGGAQRVVATLSNHWAAKGWNVDIVTLEDVQTDFYTLDARVSRHQLAAAADESRKGLWANLRRIRALRRVLLKRQPDVAVAMMETASVTLALAGRGLHTVLIGAERTHPPFSEIPNHWKLARNYCLGMLDAVVAQTEVTANWLRRHTRSRQIHVIPNPIELPLDRHDPVVPPPERDGTTRILLGMGRLVPPKNFGSLIEAFARIADALPQWRLVITGDGPERRALLSLAQKLGISSRVSLPGVVGNAGAWYQRADLFALTSTFEGFPNTLLEALAHGVPAVAVDCDAGPRDLVRHCVDGLLVPAGNVELFADNLRTLMSDDSLRAEYSRRAAEARARFSVNHITDQWRNVFESLASRKRLR